MPASKKVAPSLSLAVLLRRPYEGLSEWVYGQLAAEGLSDVRPAYSSVLRNVQPEGSTVSELARRAGLAKQSMAYLVGQMEAIGLVALTPDPNDRRAKAVQLTERGHTASRRAVELSGAYEAHLASVIGAQKAKALRAALSDVYAALESQVRDRQ